MKWMISLALVLALMSGTVQANEPTLTFATNYWAPYAAEELPGYGLSSAIISEACKRTGLKIEFEFVPWVRAMEMTKSGKYDAFFNAYHSEYRARTYAASEPYFQTQLVLCTLKESDIQYDGSTKSLYPYKLGVVRGYVNTAAIDNDESIKKDAADNDVLNLKKLLRGRVDLIAIDKYQALHLIKNNPTIEADMHDIKFLSPDLGKKSLYVMFSKNKPDWEIHLKRFNRGLREIKHDGTLNELMILYGVSVPYAAE